MKLAAMLLHDEFDLACLFVDLALERNALYEIFVFDVAGAFANNWTAVLFPLTHFHFLFHLRVVGKQNFGAEFNGE